MADGIKHTTDIMKYLQTRFLISCKGASALINETMGEEELMQACRELLADECGECGYESFEDTADGIIGYVQQDEYHEILVKEKIKEFPVEGVTITYNTEEIPDQDWNAAWEEEGFEPINVSNIVTIYDARHTDGPEQFSAPVRIGIHASNAFGTGNHETTRMIISTLLELPLEGRRVLDCGCGTGILSIAALKCGAREAVGYDIDEWSADNAKHNAELNGVSDRMEVLLGNSGILSHIEGIFDIVLANINRNILLADMESFHDVMARDAVLVLSGFYEEDAPMLIEKASSLGMKEVARKTDNGWCCLILK